ncbi:Parapinopsin [Frankliniella fusca]|uniref:Parapinopsin n=1 Tax=Frankliniella fusca TaxID=407009 RepID=A0AAE1LDW3_9NEOP|nr:Parapinopsin [Frankliniella fusca]
MARCTLSLAAVVVMLAAFLSASASSASKLRADAGQLGVEGVVDNVLVIMHRELGRLGLGTIEIPDVAGTQKGLTLECSEGMMKGLRTLTRTGSAVVDHAEDHVMLSTSLTLGALEMSYRVHARYLFLSFTSDVGATIERNSVSISVGVQSSDASCSVGVQGMRVDVLDGIQWRTTGFSTINKLVSTVLNFLVPPSTVQGWINAELDRAFRDYKVPCIALIPGLGNSTWNC